jgi:hypothetical protein
MPQQEGYVRWPTTDDIPLMLSLVDSAGAGVTGAVPQVSIRRYKETHGVLLDDHFWDAASNWFVPTPVWYDMAEYDPVVSPGIYIYLFPQNIVGLEWTYQVYYRNAGVPVGFAAETHLITNEVYIPAVQPDPVVVGPTTVMGQLELVKGLLHHNTILDRQTYDNGRLTSARLRMFATEDLVPETPDGDELSGKIAEFQLVSEYDAGGLNTKYVMKRVYP